MPRNTISREYNDALAQTNRYEVKGHELKFLVDILPDLKDGDSYC